MFYISNCLSPGELNRFSCKGCHIQHECPCWMLLFYLTTCCVQNDPLVDLLPDIIGYLTFSDVHSPLPCKIFIFIPLFFSFHTYIKSHSLLFLGQFFFNQFVSSICEIFLKHTNLYNLLSICYKIFYLSFHLYFSPK